MSAHRTPAENRSNIVLTGFMGTGKSTVGRQLARRLGREFVDTDELIEARHGPIPAIFAEAGEARFRAIEREVAAELATRRDLVVSTGGRMMLDPANVATLGASGMVVCLRASVDELVERLRDGDRPLLAGHDPRARIEALLTERRDGYARFASVDTDGRTPDEVANAVEAAVEAATSA